MSCDVRMPLENARSRSQVLQLKYQFQTTKRRNFSISGYVDKINSIAHILVMACVPVDEEDIILLLNGVGPTIESTVFRTGPDREVGP